MAQHISKQKARSMVTNQGWRFIKKGFEAYSKCGKWVVYAAGYLYKCRPCNPVW